MKLAELCTVFPANWNSVPISHPGDALPRAVRIKLRAQRGWLQASLDTHVQRSSNRSGLGLRPYVAGDSLRAVSLRHLLLQDEFLTRTDVSPGRFHVAIVVHSYENMQFNSNTTSANKMQAAWATAGLLENLHHQQAQKIDIMTLTEQSLGDGLLKHSSRLKRAHLCYIITDLLFDPSNRSASTTNLAAALKLLNIPRGMVVVVRDPLESPDIEKTELGSRTATMAFAPPSTSDTVAQSASRRSEYTSGAEYLEHVNEQLKSLEQELNKRHWSSMWLTPEHHIDDISRRLSSRLIAMKVGA